MLADIDSYVLGNLLGSLVIPFFLGLVLIRKRYWGLLLPWFGFNIEFRRQLKRHRKPLPYL